MLPPGSRPLGRGEPPAAMTDAPPLLPPPGERLTSYGLRVPPWSGFQLSLPTPPGGQFVLPIRIAPARRIRAITVASRVGMLVRSMRSPAVVGSPAVLEMSLAVNGTPCRGPRTLLRGLWRDGGQGCFHSRSPRGGTAEVLHVFEPGRWPR